MLTCSGGWWGPMGHGAGEDLFAMSGTFYFGISELTDF